jgi:acyl carrier protein
MPTSAILTREAVLSLVVHTLGDVMRARARELPAALDEDTPLLGRGSVIDSLGLVTLIVEIEQRLEERHGIIVTLADERAMSRRDSPFRTVGSLAHHVCASIGVLGAHGGP